MGDVYETCLSCGELTDHPTPWRASEGVTILDANGMVICPCGGKKARAIIIAAVNAMSRMQKLRACQADWMSYVAMELDGYEKEAVGDNTSDHPQPKIRTRKLTEEDKKLFAEAEEGMPKPDGGGVDGPSRPTKTVIASGNLVRCVNCPECESPNVSKAWADDVYVCRNCGCKYEVKGEKAK